MNKKNQIVLNTITISVFLITLMLYFSNLNRELIKINDIQRMGVYGLIVIVYIITTWHIKTGKFFSLYIIFMIFYMLFNFGQSFLWMMGVFSESDLLSSPIFDYHGPNSFNDIYVTQLITLMGIISFHTGGMLFYKKSKVIKDQTKVKNKMNNLYNYSKTLSYLVIPVQMFLLLYKFYFVQKYSYLEYYYSENVKVFIMFNLLSRFFFPVLIGMLIGSNYNNKIMKKIYFIFGIYVIFSIFNGDRGNWIILLIILVYM